LDEVFGIGHDARATRLDNFLPIGRLFTMGSLKKITEGARILATFFCGISYVFSLTKMGWATVRAIFSQTHLVTLPEFSRQVLLLRHVIANVFEIPQRFV
jgi:hypothetical protein